MDHVVLELELVYFVQDPVPVVAKAFSSF